MKLRITKQGDDYLARNLETGKTLLISAPSAAHARVIAKQSPLWMWG